MSDSSDDPLKPSEGTVLRPRPGAGRRAGAPTPVPAAGPGTLSPAPAARAESLPLESREALGTGLNPLVQAASPVLLLAQRLRTTLSLADIGALRRQTLEDLFIQTVETAEPGVDTPMRRPRRRDDFEEDRPRKIRR